MIDLKILKKTNNVNKLRYAFKQINILFAENAKVVSREVCNNLNANQIASIEYYCTHNKITNVQGEYFYIPLPLHFEFFMENLINSFIKSNVVFTANDFNQFCTNTKSVIDTFIKGCANNLYKGKNMTLCYQDILNSILNSNDIIVIKRITNNLSGVK